jgi:hypothetical protein
MLNIEALVERQLAEAEAHRASILAGAFQSEIVELFQITKDTARKAFADAVILPGRPNRETIFSRARIVEILSDLNSRPIPFPAEAMMTSAEVGDLLGIPEKYVHWLRCRTPHRLPAHVRVGVFLIRYEPTAVLDFIATRGRP